MAASHSMEAANISWDFRSGSSTPSSSSGSGFGNTRTFTSGGVTVTVSAWGLTANNNTTFQTAQSGRFDAGLGICNQDEGLNCDDPIHQIDNGGQLDFYLFQFSAPVDPLTVVIDPFGVQDRDVSYYVGNATAPLNLTGVSLAGLAALGLTGPTNNDGSPSGDPRTVQITSGVVNSMLFGARVDDSFLSGTDRFKISSMTADPIHTPEPATIGLAGLALVGLAISRFRRPANNS
jgi:hypothetical protein